jgi:uncharacterized damage-inducible protein DinB
MTRPQSDKYGSWFSRYIDKVPDGDIISTLEQQGGETEGLLARAGDGSHRYAEGKWSVKQVVGHITDAERVFAYRLMAIARGDQQSLPGFDENPYVENAAFDEQSLSDLAEALAVQRRATLMLVRQLNAEAWSRRGVANGNPISVRALAWVIAGHERHHVGILRERYGLT